MRIHATIMEIYPLLVSKQRIMWCLQKDAKENLRVGKLRCFIAISNNSDLTEDLANALTGTRSRGVNNIKA